jgi:tRNA 2-selenouridine synthase
MRESECVRIDRSLDERVNLLLEDYDFFVKSPALFCQRLDILRDLRGAAIVEAWKKQVQQGNFKAVVRELLQKHYDPGYLSSTRRNFKQFEAAKVITLGAAAEAL